MKFGVYVPSIADQECVPLLIYLSGLFDFIKQSNIYVLLGLTCTEQSFITKSGVQRLASKYGFIVANPDTSPRKLEVSCRVYSIRFSYLLR